MTHYLLLGAGFSRNWGGWLAGEVFEYLLGRPEVVNSQELRRILWDSQSKGGFEYALESLQVSARRGDDAAAGNLEKLQTSVVAMFNDMNQGFDRIVDWEFSNQREYQVATFLTKFDIIFTLNQDLFVERHYLSASPELRRRDRWNGAHMPGLNSVGTPPASIVGQRWQILSEDNFKLDSRIQPYIKLHGSTNWDSPDGNTLVVGGNKTGAIGGSPILKWYFEQFENALCAGDARLMVIGYGFRDKHINDLLIKAVNERGLKLFIVSPAGADHARRVNPSAGGAIHARSDLEDAFARGVIGASQRGLSEIFGGNGLELAKLQRFLSA
jgi:hypothetical protein